MIAQSITDERSIILTYSLYILLFTTYHLPSPMSKIIAAINTTLDGYCDHTAVAPDAEVHEHYTQLLQGARALLYGRVTYGLMEFWRPFIDQPSENEAMNRFALVMDATPKIVFSRTMQSVDWHSATLATEPLEVVVQELKAQPGGDVFVGSPGLINTLTNLNLIDEYQLCIHPVLAGKGRPLFDNLRQPKTFTRFNIKTFSSGAVILYLVPNL